jgi:hypothetical protein
MRPVRERRGRPAQWVPPLIAAAVLAACAAGPQPPGTGAGATDTIISAAAAPSPSDSVEFDRLFLEIHSNLVLELSRLEKSGEDGTTLAEIWSFVRTAEEFYLEGRPLAAIQLLTEAELLLRQAL